MGRRRQTVEEFLKAEGLYQHVIQCVTLLVNTTHGDGMPEVPGNALMVAASCLETYTVAHKKMVGRGGHFSPRRSEIGLTTLAMSPEQYRNTILHEVAHLLDWAVFRTGGHGPSWQLCAVVLGTPPKAKFVDDEFRASVAEHREAHGKIVARCKHCDYEVIKLRRSRRNWSRFFHRGCTGAPDGKGWLEPVD